MLALSRMFKLEDSRIRDLERKGMLWNIRGVEMCIANLEVVVSKIDCKAI